jgi:hypothetical protein
MITEQQFTRVNNDVNGNPRYVIHFLDCAPDAWTGENARNNHYALTERYAWTCKLMNTVGGRKFHNKQFGGGIVFQSYSLPETIAAIERAKATVE